MEEPSKNSFWEVPVTRRQHAITVIVLLVLGFYLQCRITDLERNIYMSLGSIEKGVDRLSTQLVAADPAKKEK